MKQINNKIVAVILLAAMTVFCFAPLLAAFAQPDTIQIRSAEEFSEFAKKCKTDTWSRNRTAELLQDIDFSGMEFTPVPTFGGTFYGNGYTISGISISRKGSYQGLFRYLQEGALVRDLHVEGIVAPGGSRETVGGIVGENSGTLQNCSFSGTVDGETNVGGLCGYVTETGVVEQSRFTGSVSGKSYTGGICGQNFGLVQSCENHGAVNTTHEEEAKPLQDIEVDVTELRSTQTVISNTDTGGICGYTKGKIIGCKNYGNVGYPSVGYNTGGICGRQAGYVGSCENHGEIKGRKDIGGIAGQAEPYVVLAFTKDIVGQTKDAVLEMQNGIDAAVLEIQAMVDGAGAESAVLDGVDNLNGALSNVRLSAESLLSSAGAYADDATASVNEASDRLHTALDGAPEVFEELSGGTQQMSQGLSAVQESVKYLEQLVSELNEAGQKADGDSFSQTSVYLARASMQLSQAMGELEDSIAAVSGGIGDLQNAVGALSRALEEKKGIQQQFQTIWDNIRNIQKGLSGIEDFIGTVADILQGLQERQLLAGNLTDIINNLRQMADCYRQIGNALQEIGDACLTIAGDFDIYALRSAFRMLERGFDAVASAFDALKKSIVAVTESLDTLSEASLQGKRAAERAKEGMDDIRDGADALKRALDRMKQSMEQLTADGAVSIPSLSDALRADFDTFFQSVEEMQTQVSVFTSLFRDTAADTKTDAADAVGQIGGEIGTLSGLLSDAYAVQAEDTVVEDISDQDTVQDMRGKIDHSQNYGTVSGDINVGGIVGAMAIEYDFDPEDDIVKSGDETLQFTYKTKCVVRRCTNEGETVVKKDAGGGIVGRMDLGSVLSCDAYAKVSSTDGDYVGGVAGKSNSVIRNCAVKCELSGNRYVGGIAGSGSTIANCQTLVFVSGYEEFAGAIAGQAPKGQLQGNYFINDALGGLDDISYTGAASETTLDLFVDFVKSSFQKDITFTLVFVADGEEVARVPFHYKEAIAEEKIPKVPDKSGYYGTWSSYDFAQPSFDAVISAQYHRNMDIIASEQAREDGKSVVLVCGAFDDTAQVSAAPGGTLEGKSVIDAYYVNIDGSYTETYTVRYLPKSLHSVDLYIQYDGKPEKVSAKKVGSYLEFEAKQQKFELFEVKKQWLAIWMTAVFGLAIAIAAAVFLRIRRKKAGRPAISA